MLIFQPGFKPFESLLELLQINFRQLFDQPQFAQRGGARLSPVRFLLVLDHPFERRNPHTVKFVEIVRIDPQKSEPFEQRHVIALGLLKDAAVKVHPAHVTIQHSHRTFFLCHIPVMLLSFHPTDVSYRSGPIRRHPPGGTPTQRSIIVLRRFRQQRYAGINPRPPKLA